MTPEVSPIAENGNRGHALAAIEPLEGGTTVFAELARAVEHDLATPDHAPATERAPAPIIGKTSGRSSAAIASGRYQRAPRSLALHRKAGEDSP